MLVGPQEVAGSRERGIPRRDEPLGVAYRAGQGVTVSAIESFRWFLSAQVIANQPPGGPIYEAVTEAATHLSPADQDRIGFEVYDWMVAKGAIDATPATPAPTP